jgi:hypothetical protein
MKQESGGLRIASLIILLVCERARAIPKVRAIAVLTVAWKRPDMFGISARRLLTFVLFDHLI